MPKQDLILLALDSSPTFDLMQPALRAAGFEVAIAQNEAALNQRVQEVVPALIIIGEKLAGRDGFALAAGLLERFPTLPIILYAERDSEGLAKAALKAGLSAYIYPPLKIGDILEEVKNSLARARKLGDWVRREVKRTTSSLENKAKISESEKKKLEAIISNIQDGVIVLDENRRIQFANRAIREIFRLGEKEMVGRTLEEVLLNPDLLALLERAKNEPLKYHEINFDDGRVYNGQYAPIPGVGAAVTVQDISYLKEIDRLKNDFVHTVSHDLRSPLTAVLGYTELIERTGSLNDQQREFLRRLQGSVQHITELVNDLLDLGRLEAGFDTRRELVNLDEVLKYSLDMYESEARRKRLLIEAAVKRDLPPLRANPIRIRQMIDNLIGNAVKYTPEEGLVRVELLTQDGQLIFKVSDSGPGIPPDEQPRIFEKFFRASNAPEGTPGSGLGLAIVKSIVESHQGRVWVESEPGKGSTFTVILPPQE